MLIAVVVVVVVLMIVFCTGGICEWECLFNLFLDGGIFWDCNGGVGGSNCDVCICPPISLS